MTDIKNTPSDFDPMTPEANLPPLCRMEHLLKVVPLGRSTIWAWSREKRFPAPIKVGSITVWRRDEVLEWIERVGSRP